MSPDKLKKLVILLLTLGFVVYTLIIYTSISLEKKVADTQISKGKLIWQKQNCTACHKIYGLGGYLGPDLTNIHSQKGDAHIWAMVNSGINAMPGFNLSNEELDYLVAHLTDVDASGRSDARTFRINKNGTIEK